MNILAVLQSCTPATCDYLNLNKINTWKFSSSVTLVTFQILSICVWLVVTLLAAQETEHFHHGRKFYWTDLLYHQEVRFPSVHFLTRPFLGIFFRVSGRLKIPSLRKSWLLSLCYNLNTICLWGLFMCVGLWLFLFISILLFHKNKQAHFHCVIFLMRNLMLYLVGNTIRWNENSSLSFFPSSKK